MLQTGSALSNWATDVQQLYIMHLLYMPDSLAIHVATMRLAPGQAHRLSVCGIW